MFHLRENLTEAWRRIRLEFVIELPLLKDRWKTILLGACFQYVHGIFTQLAHRLHRPQEQPLPDLGFAILPELGKVNEWVSELIFSTLFISFILWSFSPFIFERKRFYTAVLYSRLLVVLVICQTLRIISFLSTSLPAPNYHCRALEATAIKEMPKQWWGHVVVDVGRQSTHGCGDLIFSSHTTFALVGAMTYFEYGSKKAVKAIVWTAVATLSVLIVASRKHYSVDVVIAWYVVPLVFWTMHRRWTTKRPVKDEWPHRPLIDNTQVEVDLQQIVVTDDVESASQPMLASVATGRTNKDASHERPLPNGPVKTHASNFVNGAANGSSPGTPREGEQGGPAGGRKSPITTTIMRPRSVQMIAASNTAADAGSSSEQDAWDERTKAETGQLASTATSSSCVHPHLLWPAINYPDHSLTQKNAHRLYRMFNKGTRGVILPREHHNGRQGKSSPHVRRGQMLQAPLGKDARCCAKQGALQSSACYSRLAYD
ncbi:hypothetical protein WJX72_003721 [[Myrmecia] bisecta]|uniref:Sphingomyelin synthase-like domain-containing protein n=1 Tax=[Myrmecia] bisecta TaxID=41462 RepID=A0AAW1Q3M9_9CHLO